MPKVWHVLTCLKIASRRWPLPGVAGFYILRSIVLGYAMYGILALGHFPAEAQL